MVGEVELQMQQRQHLQSLSLEEEVEEVGLLQCLHWAVEVGLHLVELEVLQEVVVDRQEVEEDLEEPQQELPTPL